MHPRMRRERQTIDTMLHIYCRARHGTAAGELCGPCRELLAYAHLRLERCPFQEGKTTCGNCRVHCYKPTLRQRIREVMAQAGPRMPWRHPLLALAHLVDGLRKRPRPRLGKGEDQAA